MIEQKISELLNKYDSVILPGFGSFVLKYADSVIHPVENKISPPAKYVSFDVSIKTNDGILANYLSEKEKISFFDACSLILDFVEGIIKSLDEGNQIVLAKIGTLSKSSEGISFIPDTSVNYNSEAFGMEEIISAPILRDDVKEKIQAQYAEKKQFSKERKSFPKVALWILIIVVLGGAATAALFIIKPSFINNFNLAGLSKHQVNKGNPIAINQQKRSVESKQKAVIHSSDTLKADTIKKDTSAAQHNSIKQNKITEQISKGRFYIISASFRIKENAENYVNTLNQKGYDSKVIFLQEKGLYVVSYNSFTTKSDAEQALTNIKNTVNSSAWILNN